MATVRVKLGEPLWRAVGERETSVTCPDPATIADVLVRLAERPGFQSAYEAHATGQGPEYVLFLNDPALPSTAAAVTPCADGDTLRIILPIAGGASAHDSGA